MPDVPLADLAPARIVPRRGALDGVATLDSPGAISVLPAGPRVRLVLRGSPEIAGATGAVLGIDLPLAACRASTAGDRAALWLGPDEWLLILPPGDGTPATLAAALHGQPCSLVEVSHRQLGLLVEGPRAAELLNAACPLDLAEQAFPPGNCTRTVLGKAEITLWRTGPHSFHLEVWRSFASYVHALLAEAAAMLPP